MADQRNQPSSEAAGTKPSQQNADRGEAARGGGAGERGSSMSQGDRDAPHKEIQGGTTPGHTSGTQLGERSSDAMSDPDRGGMASTEGRTESRGGVGSAERSASQERSRGGQMGPGDTDRK